jgi:hypothetical protein
MTYLKHKDIYTKFMIEYDKANVTSSYPSLTEYEVATFLDKAYNALIAQKVTGNNVRRAPLEADIKAISDLQPLIHTTDINLTQATDVASNVVKAALPDKFLYCVAANVVKFSDPTLKIRKSYGVANVGVRAYTGYILSMEDLQDIASASEDDTKKYSLKISNVTNPGTYQVTFLYYEDGVGFSAAEYIGEGTESTVYVDLPCTDPYTFAGDMINKCNDEYLATHIIIRHGAFIAQEPTLDLWDYTYQEYPDAMDNAITRITPVRLNNHQVASKFFSSTFNMPWVKIPIAYIEDNKMYVVEDAMKSAYQGALNLTYIEKPNTFVKDLTTPGIKSDGSASYFEFNVGATGTIPSNPTVTADDYQFECNDTVAEELVSLAITFALENVESQRLNSKLNTRGLEA